VKASRRDVDVLTAKGRGSYPVLGYIGDETKIHQWNLDGEHYPIDGRGAPWYDLENPMLAMG
jgi:hypothetical protein